MYKHIHIHCICCSCTYICRYVQIYSGMFREILKYMSTFTLTHTCCNKSDVLTVSEMRAGEQTEEKNLPPQAKAEWNRQSDAVERNWWRFCCEEWLFCLNSNSGLCRPLLSPYLTAFWCWIASKKEDLMIRKVLTDRKLCKSLQRLAAHCLKNMHQY